MELAYNIFFYTFVFISVYIQIFFLVTFFEKRRQIIYSPDNLELEDYSTVTIAVPCYNEQGTIEKTVKSLLSLDYPKDKITIFLVDDGSTDNTWKIIQGLDNGQNIKSFHKENGGKHTALNLALENNTSEFFGCLDADSFVHHQALKRIIKYFQDDKENMAVTPSIVVYNPKNILQYAQDVEYDLSVYVKKMLGFMGGIPVTPGPFSIFRKKVFDDLGPYHKAHNTEDQEIALRMQENGYKIDHCPDSYVYTNTPDSIMKLYRQRLRWFYGYIKNLIDYRHLLFKKDYGTVSIFTLPSGIISIVFVLFIFTNVLGNIIKFIYHKIIQIQTVGFNSSFNFNYKFDWFYLDTKLSLFLAIFLYILIIVSVVIGRKMVQNKSAFSFSIIYFIIMCSTIAPFWVLRAIYNSIISKESSWTLEMDRRAIK